MSDHVVIATIYHGENKGTTIMGPLEKDQAIEIRRALRAVFADDVMYLKVSPITPGVPKGWL